MKERQAVAREYKGHYQKATKKEKWALLDEFIRLTGYHAAATIKKTTTVSSNKKMVPSFAMSSKGIAIFKH